MEITDEAEGKLCCGNAKAQHRVQVSLDHRARTRIRHAKHRYAELLGREVSTSVLVRRGLELLEVHLDALSGDGDGARELGLLAYHIR